MKTNYIVGAALVAMLNCTIANADLLGPATSGLNGSLGGNLSSTRDIGVTGHGNGSLGADLDTRPLQRTTRDVSKRTKQRTHDAVSATRERTKSTVANTNSATAEKVREVQSSKVSASAEGNASVGVER